MGKIDEVNGLYIKYNVTKIEDGSAVNNCFVLRPDVDPIPARAALRAYAETTTNKLLAADILEWLKTYETK